MSKVAGIEHGQRRLNGTQTTGRDYRGLSEPVHTVSRTDDVPIQLRDGTTLLADLFRPEGDGRFPALIAFSPYPRQMQDLGAPMGFIEAGATDFFVPRGYAQLIVNARGTSGSEGTWTLFDETERQDLYDVVEWAAAQPWCDGNVGMIGISYFAMAQLEAAAEKPPHLKAIFPVATTNDVYEACWHHGLLNIGFIQPWLSTVGVLAAKSERLWHGPLMNTLRGILNTPLVHKRIEHFNGEAIVAVMRTLVRAQPAEEPYGRIWREVSEEHPLRDGYWRSRELQSRLGEIDIPVYLGCDWDNVPLHLPSTFTSWEALRRNPNVRMGLMLPGGLSWPWESLHYEALAWYDHWLKGVDTGILEGEPIRYQIPGHPDQGWFSSGQWPPANAELTDFSLCSDGTLLTAGAKGFAPAERDPEAGGSRSYGYVPDGAEPPRGEEGLPDHLVWDTPDAVEPVDIVGDIELELAAASTAEDTAWIAALFAVDERGHEQPVTAGWLRASHRSVDEAASRPGAPVLRDEEAVPVPPGETVVYRIPLVPNARHLEPGQRLRLVLASADQAEGGEPPHEGLAFLGFTHRPLPEAAVNTVFDRSRLRLPILR